MPEESGETEKPKKIDRRTFLKGAAATAVAGAAGLLAKRKAEQLQKTTEETVTSAEKEKRQVSFVNRGELFPRDYPADLKRLVDYERESEDGFPQFVIKADAEGYYPDGTPLMNKLFPNGVVSRAGVMYGGLEVHDGQKINWPAIGRRLVMGLDYWKDRAIWEPGSSPVEYLEVRLENEALLEKGWPNRGKANVSSDLLNVQRVVCRVTTKTGEKLGLSISGENAKSWLEDSQTVFIKLGSANEHYQGEATNLLRPKNPVGLEGISRVELILSEEAQDIDYQGEAQITFTGEPTTVLPTNPSSS